MKKEPNMIYVLRLKNGLNQSKLAEVLNIGISSISKIEHGEIDISIGKLRLLVKLFNVSADVILSKNSNFVATGSIEELNDLREKEKLSNEELRTLQNKVIESMEILKKSE